jgi:hypothetical protein
MTEKSAWEKYKEKNKNNNILSSRTVKPWDLINPKTEHAEESVSSNRFDICKSCPELISLTSQCKQCGCFMKLKTKILHASCPLKKW